MEGVDTYISPSGSGKNIEEKHHNAQHAHRSLLLAVHRLLFDLWILKS
jgi:hypothetical protein